MLHIFAGGVTWFMNEKTRFLIEAIRSTEATIRYLDYKAGALVIFETAFLVIVISGVLGNPFLLLVQDLIDRDVVWYAALLLASLVLFASALIIHILMTIRVILPIINAEDHVSLGDYEPRMMYHLNRLDENRRIVPSVSDYAEALDGMEDAEIAGEYIVELQKLSYVRTVKSDRLATSFLLLGGLIIGITAFGFLLALAGVLF